MNQNPKQLTQPNSNEGVKNDLPTWTGRDLIDGKIPNNSLTFKELTNIASGWTDIKDFFHTLNPTGAEELQNFTLQNSNYLPNIRHFQCLPLEVQTSIQRNYASKINGIDRLLDPETKNLLLISPEEILTIYTERLDFSKFKQMVHERILCNDHIFNLLLENKAFTQKSIGLLAFEIEILFSNSDKIQKIKDQGIDIAPLFDQAFVEQSKNNCGSLPKFDTLIEVVDRFDLDIDDLITFYRSHLNKVAANLDILKNRLNRPKLLKMIMSHPNWLLNFVENQTHEYITKQEIKHYLESQTKLILSDDRNNFQRFELEQLLKLNSLLTPDNKIPVLTACSETFGNNSRPEQFYIINQLLEGSCPKELQELGIDSTGNEGLNDLKKYAQSINPRIFGSLSDNLNLINEVLASDLARDILVNEARFDVAEFGIQTAEQISPRLEKLSEIYKSETEIIEAINPAYTTQTFQIKTKKQNTNVIHPDVKNRVKKLEEMIEDSTSKNTLFTIISELKNGIRDLITRSREKLEIADKTNEKYTKSIEQKISDLEIQLSGLKLKAFVQKNQPTIENNSKYNSKAISETISFFCNDKFKDIHPILTKLIFTVSIQNNPSLIPQFEAIKNKEPLDENDLSWYINAINHITLQETWGEVLNKEATKKIRKIISVQSLNDEYLRLSSMEEVDELTSSIEFSPTRGLALEFSGQYCDACWANNYESVAKKYPKFTFIALSKIKDTTKNNIGGFFLIETTDANQNPILIIRGLNPRETEVNRLNIKEFISAVSDYTKSTAEKIGAKPTIVIDDHCGGSSSNRPKVWNYLNGIKSDLNMLKIVDSEETNFNGYDISRDIYELD
jgi:hypothetical protein